MSHSSTKQFWTGLQDTWHSNSRPYPLKTKSLYFVLSGIVELQGAFTNHMSYFMEQENIHMPCAMHHGLTQNSPLNTPTLLKWLLKIYIGLSCLWKNLQNLMSWSDWIQFIILHFSLTKIIENVLQCQPCNIYEHMKNNSMLQAIIQCLFPPIRVTLVKYFVMLIHIHHIEKCIISPSYIFTAHILGLDLRVYHSIYLWFL